MWINPYERLGLRCNPFTAEQIPGVTEDLWLDRGFSQPPQPRGRVLFQFIGEKGAGKTSHLLHWRKQTGGSYTYYPPGWGRWQIPPVEPISYWDEADRIPIPLLLAALAQASYQGATIVAGTHEDLSWVGRFVRLKIRTIKFHRLTPETILAWAEKRIQAVTLPEVKQVGLKLDRADIELIVANASVSWREVATYLHIWAAKIANQ
ncbi:hypothetical protein [Okeania sp. SIO2B3]|uniref:hypothetical protein n=1 Tax=Okeania sp. SIO2B3 TaxID=2607784 RepID=UPI0025F2DF3B|nr:hypothetical protein [Okeania sp. SIO2B3]